MKFSLLFFMTLILSRFFAFPLFPEERIKDSPKEKKKQINLYFSPLILSNSPNYESQERFENKSITILYNVKENLFIGFSYSQGKIPNDKIKFITDFTNNETIIYNESNSRKSEYFTLKAQRFINENLYFHAGWGIKKGFTQEYNNFLIISPYGSHFAPYSRKLAYSNRFYTTIGLGYRKEMFENFIFGLEVEYGFINPSYIRDNSLFDPNYFGGAPKLYLIEQYLISKNNISESSKFGQINFYSGIVF